VRAVSKARVGDEHGWLVATGEDLDDVDPDDLPEGPVEVVPGAPFLVPLLGGLLAALALGGGLF